MPECITINSPNFFLFSSLSSLPLSIFHLCNFPLFTFISYYHIFFSWKANYPIVVYMNSCENKCMPPSIHVKPDSASFKTATNQCSIVRQHHSVIRGKLWIPSSNTSANMFSNTSTRGQFRVQCFWQQQLSCALSLSYLFLSLASSPLSRTSLFLLHPLIPNLSCTSLFRSFPFHFNIFISLFPALSF